MEVLSTEAIRFSTPKKPLRMGGFDSPSTQRTAGDFLIDKENDTSAKASPVKTNGLSKPRILMSATKGDRFIPVRRSGKTPYGANYFEEEARTPSKGSPTKKNDDEGSQQEHSDFLINNFLRSEMLGMSEGHAQNRTSFQNNNIFKYSERVTPFDPLNMLENFERASTLFAPKKKQGTRKIPKLPFKVLDAPALQDDFYLNLLDWSDSNYLSVGLGSCVYLWSGANNRVFKVCDLGSEDMVTSVSWAQKGQLLGIGTNSGEVHIWDINKVKRVRNFEGHSARVGAVSWSQDCLASGSRDKTILLRDTRESDNFYSKLTSHTQEVCGLKWSHDSQMFASGGNDNKMYIWTPKSTTPIFKTSVHKAAVKALAWSPHQHGLLASGGGTADKCIRFWNAHKSQMVSSVDTGSQVCNLLFAKNSNELVSTHGYTDNQIHVWSYPQMKKLSTLTGHSYRVLYLAMSPDGNSIVTGAGDETLRFWHMNQQTTATISPATTIDFVSMR